MKKLSKRQRRTARKLVLPLIAIGMMATMMFMESSKRSEKSSPGFRPAPSAAARTPHDVQRR